MKREPTPSPVEQMLAKQACRDLVAQAALLTDTRNHEGFAALFTDDGVLIRPAAQPLQGHAAIVASYRAKPAERITRHLISNTLVTLESETLAHATSCVLLWTGLESDMAGPFGRPAQARQLIGELEDRFLLTPKGWRIHRREARFILFREEDS
jgi:uncharacterized protein (TIGR02246 family)